MPPSPHLSPTLAWFLNLWFRGETALHKAACQRNRAVCQLLVDAGASLRQTDSKVTGWVSASILPLWEIAGTVASTCACSTSILSVLMEGPGALGKGGKNRVLHLEKLQFKWRSTKGGCAFAWVLYKPLYMLKEDMGLEVFSWNTSRQGMGKWDSQPEDRDEVECMS